MGLLLALLINMAYFPWIKNQIIPLKELNAT